MKAANSLHSWKVAECQKQMHWQPVSVAFADILTCAVKLHGQVDICREIKLA